MSKVGLLFLLALTCGMTLTARAQSYSPESGLPQSEALRSASPVSADRRPSLCGGHCQLENGSALLPSGTGIVKPSTEQPTCETHRFWDQRNAWLFAGVGAVRMLDYASTRHFRNQGNDEWLLTNSIVDNKPLFVGIELAGTAASIGISYLFHRTGHHNAERWVSIIHIGVGVAGSIHNYSLAPPAAAPK